MAIDPYAAAMDALKTYLAEIAGVANALRGWPEHNKKLNLKDGAFVSVSAIGKPDLQWETPAPLAEEAAETGLLVTWRLGLAVFEVAVDLWAQNRKDRDQVSEAIVRAFDPNIPFEVGLELETAAYYSQTASYEVLSGPETIDDEVAASTGEWRSQWVVEVGIGLVAQAASPKQAQQIIRAQTDGFGGPVTDADLAVGFR